MRPRTPLGGLVSDTLSPCVPGTEWTVVYGMEVWWVIVTRTSSKLSSCSSLNLSKNFQVNSLFRVSLKPTGMSQLPAGWFTWRRCCVLLSYLQSRSFSRASFLSLDWGTQRFEWGGLFSQLLIHLRTGPAGCIWKGDGAGRDRRRMRDRFWLEINGGKENPGKCFLQRFTTCLLNKPLFIAQSLISFRRLLWHRVVK